MRTRRLPRGDRSGAGSARPSVTSASELESDSPSATVSKTGFCREVFSDDGAPSFSRVVGGVLAGFACGWLTFLVVHNRALPDGATLTGLAALVSAPYALNQGRAAVESALKREK